MLGGFAVKNNYLVGINHGWEALLQKDPEEVADFMEVKYQKPQNLFIVPHLNENYVVDCINKTIRRERDGSLAGLELTMLMLHYLTFYKTRAGLEHTWVSLKEIPNGGILFYPAFYGEAIKGLIEAFGGSSQLFLKCAKMLGGHVSNYGETSSIFYVFPKIPICVVIWEGDEEVPANATVLFDKSISHFLHIESIIGIGSYLAKKLINLARAKFNSNP